MRFRPWAQSIISASSWAVLGLTVFSFALCTYLQVLAARMPHSLRPHNRPERLHSFELVALSLALAGVFLSPLWFAGHLLLIIKKSDLLNTVIHSVCLMDQGRAFVLIRAAMLSGS